MTTLELAETGQPARRARVESSAFVVAYLFAAVAGVGAASCVLALAGVIPYWAASAINFVVLYLLRILTTSPRTEISAACRPNGAG